MRIFVTGASGYIGSAAVKDMRAAGHDVVGLVRSDEGEAKLRALGAEILRGDLSDHASLRRGAEQSDAVAHLAFSQDLTKLVESGREEAEAITLMGEVLAGTESPSEKGLSDRDCCDSRGLRDLIWSYHVDPSHPAAA